MQLTLVDSVGNAYAGRLVFAHYNSKPHLKISADKYIKYALYLQRFIHRFSGLMLIEDKSSPHPTPQTK